MTTYYYVTDWKDYLIDSSLFHNRYGHENPKVLPIKNRIQIAAHVNIGNFELGMAAKSEIKNFIDITSDTRPDDPSVKLHSGLYYHCNDVFNPEIGDVRIQFTTAGIEGNYVSFHAKKESFYSRDFDCLFRFPFAVHNRWPIREWPNRTVRDQHRDKCFDHSAWTPHHRRCFPCSPLRT